MTSPSSYEIVNNVGIITIDNQPVNALSQQYMVRRSEVVSRQRSRAVRQAHFPLNRLTKTNSRTIATNRPADIIGLHFFSPAHIMKLLEVVPVRRQFTARRR